MENILSVHVIKSNADLYKEAPNSIFTQILVFGLVTGVLPFLEKFMKISVLAELHHDVDPAAIRNERIVVFNDVLTVHL